MVETKQTYKSYNFASEVVWETGRRSEVHVDGKPNLKVSSPPEFKGEADLWSPEDLFVAALNTCTLMTFVAVAANRKLELVSYSCRAEGLLEFMNGNYRFSKVGLHPCIVVKTPADIERAQNILESAHANCFISNSISSVVTITPEISVAPMN